MVVDRPCREEESRRNLVVAKPGGDEAQDLELALREAGGVDAGCTPAAAWYRGRTELAQAAGCDRSSRSSAESIERRVGALNRSNIVALQQRPRGLIRAVQGFPGRGGLGPASRLLERIGFGEPGGLVDGLT